MNNGANDEKKKTIKILIVDDSLVFRRFLGDIFGECPNIEIVGEAQNGIEALDLILKVTPDVILLDMEMPLMDGMTALQHLMIHRPTPVIMFSSLSEEGTARCFDTLKNGAVDFLCKDFIFEQSNLKNRKTLIVSKVEKASRMSLKARNPVQTSTSLPPTSKEEELRVVFCEECGSRQTFSIDSANPIYSIRCGNCGDTMDVSASQQSQYKRNNFITTLAGGYGSYFNLLEIVPNLNSDMVGAILVIIQGKADQVDNFAEYLDAISAINVVRAREGTIIEGGNCYIVSGSDSLAVKQVSTQLTLQKVTIGPQGGPIDILLASVSTLFKNRTAAVILSGDEQEGEKGVAILLKNGGLVEILNPSECYSTALGNLMFEKLKFAKSSSSSEILEMIDKNHNESRFD